MLFREGISGYPRWGMWVWYIAVHCTVLSPLTFDAPCLVLLPPFLLKQQLKWPLSLLKGA